LATENIADRAAGFGMPGVIVDGSDFFAVFDAAGAAIERARRGDGPTLLETKVSRYMGHYEGDAQTYRAPDEVEKYRKASDCLMRFRGNVVASKQLTAAELDAIDAEVKALIDRAVSKAKEDPAPDPARDLLTDVYAAYP
jgi:acetoin:2,6-dichlorophenolindophenol oxidoreductase subunit alpha